MTARARPTCPSGRPRRRAWRRWVRTLDARRAGMYAANTVTSVPTTIEMTIVLELTTVPPAGSANPRAVNASAMPLAVKMPATTPIAEANRPVTIDSTARQPGPVRPAPASRARSAPRKSEGAAHEQHRPPRIRPAAPCAYCRIGFQQPVALAFGHPRATSDFSTSRVRRSNTSSLVDDVSRAHRLRGLQTSSLPRTRQAAKAARALGSASRA